MIDGIAKTLLQTKREDGKIIAMLPTTSYDQVLNAPKATEDLNNANGAPLVFFIEEVVSEEGDEII